LAKLLDNAEFYLEHEFPDCPVTIAQRLAESRAPLKAIIEQLEREFSRLNHQLEEYNADFQALQQIEKHADLFSAAERNELRALLGLYGIETNKRLPPANAEGGDIAQRQQLWRQIEQMARSNIRREVAERAVYRYGVILNELE
jgi:hypothetical protein